MQVKVEALTGFYKVIDCAMFTQGTNRTGLSTKEFLRKAIISEHSPLRAFIMQIDVYGIPYYSHVHFVRHHVGVTPFVRTQRPDAHNPVDYDRTKAPQDAPVDMRLILNAQALLNIMKKRLCNKADPITQLVARNIRDELAKADNLFMNLLAEYCSPSCGWQGYQCHEAFGGCGRCEVEL